MNFEALLIAPWHIQVHAFAALAALFLGVIQFSAPKGTLPHRLLGTIWVVLIAIVIISAVFIVRPRPVGASFFAHFTLIHYIFIPVTTIGLIGGLYRIGRGGPRMRFHSKSFLGIFIGGLIIAGLFTLIPGRIMHDVVFDKSLSQNQYFYTDPYFYFIPGVEPPLPRSMKTNDICTNSEQSE